MEPQLSVSPAVGIVWQLAAREAVVADFDAVVPEHFLVAILKLSEANLEQTAAQAKAPEVAQFTEEIAMLRGELADMQVDTRQLRQDIRKRMGKGPGRQATSEMHRSKDSRAVFVRASELARDEGVAVVTSRHLLRAILAEPTDVVRQIVTPQAPKPRKSAKQYLLNRYGEDLAQKSDAKSQVGAERLSPEAQVVLKAIFNLKRKCVFVVAEDNTVFRALACCVALKLSKKQPPCQVIDLTGVDTRARQSGKQRPSLMGLLAEGREATHILLLLSFVGHSGSDDEASEWFSTLKEALMTGSAPVICHIHEVEYRRFIKGGAEWRRLAHAVWVRSQRTNVIPSAL